MIFIICRNVIVFFCMWVFFEFGDVSSGSCLVVVCLMVVVICLVVVILIELFRKLNL